MQTRDPDGLVSYAQSLEAEVERLQNVILDFLDMVDGKGSPPIPVIISQMRLFINQQQS